MRLLTTLALALLIGTGCGKPKAGDKCEEVGRRACVDAKSALYCAGGTWQLDTCRGPKGCVEDKGIATCDLTENAEGDPCPAALDGFGACRSDKTSRALCQKGKYVVEPCRGPDGCTMQQGGMSTCDHSVTKLGDRCTVDSRVQMCADKSFVRCKDGVITLGQKCPGPNGCRDEGGGRVSCDPNGEFAEGDLCHFIAGTCTADGKALLACRDGKFAKDKSCPGPEGCKYNVCDSGIAKVGEGCTGKAACSDDGKALLACTSPTKKGEVSDLPLVWVVDKKCKTSCTPKDGQLICD
jgi:hypothetical protein